jgi:beta-N-acetylhexosaminidase
LKAGREARAVILGCAGARLGEAERDFFRESDPLGFILFQRNCRDKAQVQALVSALRAAVGRGTAPVLIDQEGGRVARLTPPTWRAAPSARSLARVAERSLEGGCRAVWLNARLIAAELAELGITVDCAPVLDLAWPEAHAVIGDRAFGAEPARVALLGRSMCDGLAAGGIAPVIKHIPGHGRARADSHLELPAVEATWEALRSSDFGPFKALADQPWAMTAHIRFSAIDPAHPATTSPKLIAEVVRGEIGFEGALLTDDLGMKALAGGLGTRTAEALAAGCDVALHCSGIIAEMAEVTAAAPRLSGAAARRVERALEPRQAERSFDVASARVELDALLAAA